MAIEGGSDVRSFVDQLQRLQEMLEGAKKSLFKRDSRVVDKAELDQIASALAASVPEILPKASAIVTDEAGIIEAAQAQAKQLVDAATQEATRIAEQSRADYEAMVARINEAKEKAAQMERDCEARRLELASQAQEQANSIVEDGKRQAAQIAADAQAEAERLVSEDNIFRRAQMAAQELTEATNNEMGQLRQRTFTLLDGLMGKGESYITSLVQELHQERENLNGMR